jgi:hypothetical protein
MDAGYPRSPKLCYAQKSSDFGRIGNRGQGITIGHYRPFIGLFLGLSAFVRGEETPRFQ